MADDETQDKSLADRVEDLVYTTVGLGVLAVNRAQVARRRLQAEVDDAGLSTLVAPLAELGDLARDPERLQGLLAVIKDEISEIDRRVEGVEQRLGEMLDRIEPELPPALRELSVSVRSLAAEHAEQVRAALGLEDPA